VILPFCQQSRCPDGCKFQVSKGIVHAVNNYQGRFLELNQKTGLYIDIGEEKAIKKTSQALRDGQNKIKRLFGVKSEEDSTPRTPDDYLAYSVKVLSALYAADHNPLLKKNTNNNSTNSAVQKNVPDQFPLASQSINNRQPLRPPTGTIPDSSDGMSVSMASLSMNNVSQLQPPTGTIPDSSDDMSMSMASLSMNNKSQPLQPSTGKIPDSSDDMSMSMASLSINNDVHTISSGERFAAHFDFLHEPKRKSKLERTLSKCRD
jgi:hypothetical protein